MKNNNNNKLCLSSFAYIRYPIEEAIQRTAKVGYDAIEIVANRPHVLPEDYTSRDLKRIAALVRDSGLKVPAITSFNGTAQWHFTHPNPKVRLATVRHVKECVDLAGEFDSPLVEIVTGTPMIEGVDQKDAWAWLRQDLGECADYAKSSGKAIGLEPEPGNVISTTDLAAQMIREVKSPGLKFLIDVGHLNVVKENIPESIRKTKGKLAHIHVHDNDSTKDQHLIPGEGNIDFKAIFAVLKEIGYNGYISAELEGAEGDDSAIAAKSFLDKML